MRSEGIRQPCFSLLFYYYPRFAKKTPKYLLLISKCTNFARQIDVVQRSMMDDFYYRKLNVYHKAKEMVVCVYQLVKSFPSSEQCTLGNQLQRAAISVPSKMAEGMGAFSVKERIHFLELAHGSLMETLCQVELACMLGYVTDDQLKKSGLLTEEESRLLIGLRKTFEDKLNVKQ